MSPNYSHYTAVLLAAGKGTRMAAFSDQYPKPILPIANKALLVHQIELLAELGIKEVVILVGYKGYQITRLLGDGSQLGVTLQYVEQTQMLGIAHAVGQLEAAISKPFLLFLGDIYFIPRDIASMFDIFERHNCGAVLATKHESDPAAIRRNFSVVKNDDGRVVRVIEKPRHVTNNLKGVGLYLFGLNIFDAIRRTPRTAMRDEYEITEAIQVLIDDGVPVRTADAVFDDINLTYPEDLLKVNLDLAMKLPGSCLIHPTAMIHPEAKISNSVIGPNVSIGAKVAIDRCVLFDGVRIDTAMHLSEAIVTQRNVVRCQAVEPKPAESEECLEPIAGTRLSSIMAN